MEKLLGSPSPSVTYKMYAAILLRLLSALEKSLHDFQACQPLVLRIVTLLDNVGKKQKTPQRLPENAEAVVECLESFAAFMKKCKHSYRVVDHRLMSVFQNIL